MRSIEAISPEKIFDLSERLHKLPDEKYVWGLTQVNSPTFKETMLLWDKDQRTWIIYTRDKAKHDNGSIHPAWIALNGDKKGKSPELSILKKGLHPIFDVMHFKSLDEIEETVQTGIIFVKTETNRITKYPKIKEAYEKQIEPYRNTFKVADLINLTQGIFAWVFGLSFVFGLGYMFKQSQVWQEGNPKKPIKPTLESALQAQPNQLIALSAVQQSRFSTKPNSQLLFESLASQGICTGGKFAEELRYFYPFIYTNHPNSFIEVIAIAKIHYPKIEINSGHIALIEKEECTIEDLREMNYYDVGYKITSRAWIETIIDESGVRSTIYHPEESKIIDSAGIDNKIYELLEDEFSNTDTPKKPKFSILYVLGSIFDKLNLNNQNRLLEKIGLVAFDNIERSFEDVLRERLVNHPSNELYHLIACTFCDALSLEGGGFVHPYDYLQDVQSVV